MSNRPPVFDPGKKPPRSVFAEVAVAVCLAAGLLFVGFMIFMAYALRSWGNNK